MGLFSKLFKGPQPDLEKSGANAQKVRALFDQAVENGMTEVAASAAAKVAAAMAQMAGER